MKHLYKPTICNEPTVFFNISPTITITKVALLCKLENDGIRCF